MTAVRCIGIKQVAGEAGVSAHPVSRGLNARPDVASDTRQRVQEIKEQLGFRPGVLSRTLIPSSSGHPSLPCINTWSISDVRPWWICIA